jgi:hypothetical protein
MEGGIFRVEEGEESDPLDQQQLDGGGSAGASIKRRKSILADMIRESLLKEDLLVDDDDDDAKRAQDFYNILHGFGQSMKNSADNASDQETGTGPLSRKPRRLDSVELYEAQSSGVVAELEVNGDDLSNVSEVGYNSRMNSSEQGDASSASEAVQFTSPSHVVIDEESKVIDVRVDQKDRKSKQKPSAVIAPPPPRTFKDDVEDLCITSASSRGITFREPYVDPNPNSRAVLNRQASLRLAASSARRNSLTKTSSVCLTASVGDEGDHSVVEVSEAGSVASHHSESDEHGSIKVVARRRSIEELAVPLRRGSTTSISSRRSSIEPTSPTLVKLQEPTSAGSGSGQPQNEMVKDMNGMMNGFKQFQVGYVDDDDDELGIVVPSLSMRPRTPNTSLLHLLPKPSVERRLFYGPISMTRGTNQVKFSKKLGKLKLKDSRFNHQSTVSSIKSHVAAPRLATVASLHTAHRQPITRPKTALPGLSRGTERYIQRPEQTRPVTR